VLGDDALHAGQYATLTTFHDARVTLVLMRDLAASERVQDDAVAVTDRQFADAVDVTGLV
jgi:hypothetical protein